MSWDASLWSYEDRPPVSEVQLAWIAGILEGEGCFRLRRQSPASRSWRGILDVQVNMTDEDVVRRLHEISKLGTFHGPYGGKPPRKPFWVWKVSGAADAQALMEAVLPWMGKRRTEQIKTIIDTYLSQPAPKNSNGFRVRKSNWHVRVLLDEVASFNYTHNTSCMIYDALKVAGITLAEDENWWKRLRGMSGAEGREYLSAIIGQLEAEPGKYRPMNPPNGWGDYDRLLKVLREMRDAAEEGSEYVWRASG